MRQKQIEGPLGIVAIVLVVLIAVGFGYWYLNKDSMGKESVARKLGAPGVVPPGADPKAGPFPNDPGNLSKVPAGATIPAAATPPPGAQSGGP